MVLPKSIAIPFFGTWKHCMVLTLNSNFLSFGKRIKLVLSIRTLPCRNNSHFKIYLNGHKHLCLTLLNTIFGRNDTPKLPFWGDHWLHCGDETHSHVFAILKVESEVLRFQAAKRIRISSEADSIKQKWLQHSKWHTMTKSQQKLDIAVSNRWCCLLHTAVPARNLEDSHR